MLDFSETKTYLKYGLLENVMSALINSFTLIRTSFSLPTRLALVVDIMSCSVDWPKEILRRECFLQGEKLLKRITKEF